MKLFHKNTHFQRVITYPNLLDSWFKLLKNNFGQEKGCCVVCTRKRCSFYTLKCWEAIKVICDFCENTNFVSVRKKITLQCELVCPLSICCINFVHTNIAVCSLDKNLWKTVLDMRKHHFHYFVKHNIKIIFLITCKWDTNWDFFHHGWSTMWKETLL